MKNSQPESLSGIRVIELTMGGAGPMVGKILADFGADVLRVENPNAVPTMKSVSAKEGEDLRDKNTLFLEFNRNKRGILMDVKTPKGMETLKRLVSISDVVIENLNPQAVFKLGIPYEILKQYNPTLIMVSVGGLGKKGAYGHWTTWGPNLLPFTGTTLLWNHPHLDHPVGTQLVHPDFFSGMLASTVLLAAIRHRSLTGEGQYFDYSQAEAASNLIGPQLLDYSVNGRLPEPKGNSSELMGPHGIYRCTGEDSWVAIAVKNDHQWRKFKKVMDKQSKAHEKKFDTLSGRINARDELDSCIQVWTNKQSSQDVVSTLQSVGIAAGELSTSPELKDNVQLNARGFWISTKHPYLKDLLFAAPPIKLSDTPWRFNRRAPLLGEHDAEVYDELLAMEI